MWNRIGDVLNRVGNSAVVWSWGLNGLRLASGLLLLPLVVKQLEKTEFAMYFLFLSIAGLVPFVDLGLSWSVGRFVSYARAGARTLQAQGLPEPDKDAKDPNYILLWQLLRGISSVYKYITFAGFLIAGTYGTIIVFSVAGETPRPQVTWLAWGMTLIAAIYELYMGWWSVFLFGLNRVQENARFLFIGYLIRLILASALLLMGGGLLSLPIGALLGTFVSRRLTRKAVLSFLSHSQQPADQLPIRDLLSILWPNSWRLALQVFSNYLRTQAIVPVCGAIFGLEATADFGLSLQIFAIATGMAMVWTTVKWPMVAQLRSAHDFQGLRQLIWPRLWLQLLTFILLAGMAVTAGPLLLELMRTDKRLLPTTLLLIMGVSSLLDTHFIFWGSLLAAENRVPTLWSTVATNVATLLLAIILGLYTPMGMLALVVAPLTCGVVCIYWYWPRAGARSLGTTWARFMFQKPSAEARAAT